MNYASMKITVVLRGNNKEEIMVIEINHGIQQQKKEYHTPEIQELGSIRDLTSGTRGSLYDDTDPSPKPRP
jgi:hypothetical protein